MQRKRILLTALILLIGGMATAQTLTTETTTSQHDPQIDPTTVVNLTGPQTMCPRCSTPNDPDNDGVYEDVNGDGALNASDVAVLRDRLDVLRMDEPDDAGDAAYFEFSDSHGDTFIMKLTDQDTIQTARTILKERRDDRERPPEENDTDGGGDPIGKLGIGDKPRKDPEPFVSGTITKESAWYNTEWDYHYQPASIDFVEVSAEVCDSAIYYLQLNLDAAGGSYLPDLDWCPWSSRLEHEVRVEPTGPYFDFNQNGRLATEDVALLTSEIIRASDNPGDIARQHQGFQQGQGGQNAR